MQGYNNRQQSFCPQNYLQLSVEISGPYVNISLIINMGKRRRLHETSYKTEDNEDAISEIKEEKNKAFRTSTFSLGQRSGSKRNDEKRLIVVLERANLESIKNGKVYELMNGNDHRGLIKKFNKDPKNYRPDILHQCLLTLQDSPLNQAGLLQVYIHSEKNTLIEVHPQCRIPYEHDKFNGLMVQLLHRLAVRDLESNMKLLKVIKNPIQDHLPVGCKKIGTSFTSKILVDPLDLVPEKDSLVIVIGAMAHGKVEADYVEEEYSFTKYHLSAASTCSKVCSAFSKVWGVGR